MIYMMIGIQGSGKTTYAKNLAKELNCEYISTDMVRKNNPNMPEKDVFPYVYDSIAECVRNKKDVIFDATNPTPKVRERLFAALRERMVDFEVIAYFIDTDVNVCYERVMKRNLDKNELYLPPEVVFSYARSLVPPFLNEGFKEIRIVKDNKVVEKILKKINLRNDYCGISHPIILDELKLRINNQYVGYGEDEESLVCKKMIQREIDNDAEVVFLVGGTSTNKIAIGHALKNYEAVIACDTGHINVHETGAIEETGHKVITVKNINGKIDLESAEKEIRRHNDFHMVKPQMIYISNTTEYGTVYTKDELLAIRDLCDKYNLYFYLDGARLFSALSSPKCDYDLKFIASVCDMFYLGGTKIGLPYGEALIITNEKLKTNIKYDIKRYGGMLAKGFITSLMFRIGLEKNIFKNCSKKENDLAKRLENGLRELGIKFLMNGESNQIFPIIKKNEYDKLIKELDFEIWDDQDENMVIRLVTSYMTSDEDIDRTIDLFKKIKEIN